MEELREMPGPRMAFHIRGGDKLSEDVALVCSLSQKALLECGSSRDAGLMLCCLPVTRMQACMSRTFSMATNCRLFLALPVSPRRQNVLSPHAISSAFILLE